jgi:predicted RNA-binding protein associated with RNAse of E/G family
MPTIRLYLPDTAFSVWLFFGKDGAFASWYGNLEAPYQRTPIGVDAQDHALDVVADAKGRWRWKDEAEFARRLALGLDTAEHQERVWAAGRDFIARFEANASPFNRGWQDWHAPAEWMPRPLPDGWDADYGTHARPALRS